MLEILVGALVVSVIHALMPDHWIPMVLVSRAEGWSTSETLWTSVVVTFPHMISTIILGFIVGIIGFQLSAAHELFMKAAAPIMFVLMGSYYVYMSFRGGAHHHGGQGELEGLNGRSRGAIMAIMATALFFSPCVPMGSYFFVVGAEGASGMLLVSMVYVSVTLIILLLMVYLGRMGVERIHLRFLEHNESLITGIILALMGVLVYIVEA
jgi:hypothetical protein